MASHEKKPKGYSAKTEAREFMPSVLAALKEEVMHGKGISRTTAAAQIVKIAELESVVETDVDVPIRFVEVGNDADGKIIQLPVGIGLNDRKPKTDSGEPRDKQAVSG